MADYLCTKQCFRPIHEGGPSRIFRKDEIYDFDEAPENYFIAMSEAQDTLDFAVSSEDILMKLKWKPSQLKKFMKDEYNIDVKLPEKKQKLVDRLLYARSAAIGTPTGQ